VIEKIANKIKKTSASFILYGAKGVGKKYTVLEIAKSLMCKKTPPCNTCDECRRLNNGTHPNITLISPRNKDIRIESVRGLLENLAFSPPEAGKRLVIIDDAHRLNQSSANALLKVIEEPPRDTAFFLLTPNLHKMLPTIISRCETIHVPPLSDDKLAEILQIPRTHQFIYYAKGSATTLKFLLDNEQQMQKLLSFVEAPKNSYPLIKTISDDLIDIIKDQEDIDEEDDESEKENTGTLSKAKELENFEYITALMLLGLLRKEDKTLTPYVNKIKDTAKAVYSNTPYSTVLENMLLELAGS